MRTGDTFCDQYLHWHVLQITDDHRLFIKCGVLESFDIHINDIEWIKKSNELTNAPALSTDRLEIGYKGGRILVSPRDKNKFIEDLKKVNSKLGGQSSPTPANNVHKSSRGSV